MTQLIYSYTLSLETKIKVGNNPGSMVGDEVDFLDQDIANIMEGGKMHKFAFSLAPGSGGQRTYDVRDFGINYLRSVLIKVTGSSNIAAPAITPLKINATIDGKQISGRTIFADLDEPTSLPVPAATSAINLVLNNPNVGNVDVIIIVVGY